MENTFENKQKYFAAHWGQKILFVDKYKGIRLVDRFFIYDALDGECSYLELIPLSQITDEDAIEVAKRNPYSDYKEGVDKSSYIFHVRKNIKAMALITSIADYLRSKSYLLPYNGVSTETLIQWGWVKEKVTDKN